MSDIYSYMIKIGIIGAGMVGGALARYYKSRGCDIGIYDPNKGFSDKNSINNSNIVFICVPTPYIENKGFDDSCL